MDAEEKLFEQRFGKNNRLPCPTAILTNWPRG